MGEAAVSSGFTAMEADAAVPSLVEIDGGVERRGGGSPTAVVKWERFLPKMVLRVLLVEADDSTRQIIAALLRKCSYRVSAVSDGLTAWELLKGRPHNVDIILTEVELPSISGYALLTLIMEHDICKNIPVIMMSSQDSVTTVYKCMMRGAADYLVKPIRKNELQHLWQHVWRRQSSTSRADGGQSDNVESQKVEATAENNAASNHSSGYMACLDRDKEFIEKGSGSQSSCTKPDVEADSSEIQPNQDSNMDMMKVVVPENITATEKVVVMQENAYDGLAVAASSHSQSKDTGPEIHEWNAKITMAAYDDDAINFNPGIEAINLIGAFSSHHDGSYMDSLNFGTRKFDAPPELGLSLRRSESCFTSQRSEERHSMLNHSDGSAFSRYVNKPVNRVAMRPENLPILEGEFEKNPGREVSCVVKAYNLDNRNPAKGSPDRVISLTDAQSGQSECIPSHHQGRVVPAPIPVSDVRFENFRTELSAVQPEAYCTQSGPSPGPSPMSAVQHKSFLRVDSFQQSSCGNNSPERVKDTPDLIASNSSNQSRQNHNRDLKFDSLEDRGHISPATGRSITSNLCNGGTLTHRHSTDCGSVSGSNGNVNHVAVARYADEKRSGEESSQRLILREAALAKFRLKRKDRCYEKKVRYESRKKLAEQRPRVKGQFVRQVQGGPPEETNP